MDIDYLVIVADGARARFFTVEPVTQPFAEAGPRLIEQDDLANTEHEQGGRDKYSSTRTGVNLNPRGGPSHGYDDHRARREQAHVHRFAEDIAARAISLAQKHHVRHLVVTAERRMLGSLREALEIPVKLGIEVRELAKDLTKLTSTQLHEHLTAAGVVQVRHIPKVS
jgi:protein required for attachment to host cells